MQGSLFYQRCMDFHDWIVCGLVKSSAKHFRCHRLQESDVDLPWGLHFILHHTNGCSADRRGRVFNISSSNATQQPGLTDTVTKYFFISIFCRLIVLALMDAVGSTSWAYHSLRRTEALTFQYRLCATEHPVYLSIWFTLTFPKNVSFRWRTEPLKCRKLSTGTKAMVLCTFR